MRGRESRVSQRLLALKYDLAKDLPIVWGGLMERAGGLGGVLPLQNGQPLRECGVFFRGHAFVLHG